MRIAREKDRLREPVQDMAQVIGCPVVFMLINFPPFHLKAAVAGILRVAVAKDENRLFRILFLRELHLAVQPDEVGRKIIVVIIEYRNKMKAADHRVVIPMDKIPIVKILLLNSPVREAVFSRAHMLSQRALSWHLPPALFMLCCMPYLAIASR